MRLDTNRAFAFAAVITCPGDNFDLTLVRNLLRLGLDLVEVVVGAVRLDRGRIDQVARA